MRLVRFLFCYVLLSAFGALLILFLAQNWGTTQVEFFGQEYSIRLAWILAGSAAVGMLVTLVLLLPGRLAAMVHSWGLERELRQWEQDLGKLHEQYGRLLSRHERLLDAHERVLQAHHRLVGEHSQVVAERDEVHAQLAQRAEATQLAAARASATHQAAQAPSRPHVAVVSPVSATSAVSSGGRTAMPAVSRPHTHLVRGGRGSMSAPRWAVPRVPCSPGRPVPAPAAQTSGESLQITAGDAVPGEASEVMPAVHQPAAMVQQMEQVSEPIPAVLPLPAAAEPSAPRAAPRTIPLLSTEPVTSTSAADPAAPVASLLVSLRRAADRTIAFITPRLAQLRIWLHTTVARIGAALAANWVLLEAQMAHLKQSILQGAMPLDSSRSILGDLPGGDDRS